MVLSIRIIEHKRAVQRGDAYNGISLHANTTMHNKKKIQSTLYSRNINSGLQVYSSWITCS